jgi:hypothetical protein
MAEKSNAERYNTHFSAFDLSAISGFLFCLDRINRNKQCHALPRGAMNDTLVVPND